MSRKSRPEALLCPGIFRAWRGKNHSDSQPLLQSHGFGQFGALPWFCPPKVIFFPEGQPQYLNIFIEAPIGTDIEETNDITKKLEARIFNYVKKFDEQVVVDGKELTKNFLVESVIAQVGEGTSDPSQGASFNNTPHKARITVSFVEFKYRRGENTSDVLAEVRKLVQGIPGIEVVVDKNQNGPPQGKPVNIEISAKTLTRWRALVANFLLSVKDSKIKPDLFCPITL